MTEKPMTVAEVANFLRRSIKSVKRLPIPFSRVGKGRLYCCVLLAMPVGNRLLISLFRICRALPFAKPAPSVL